MSKHDKQVSHNGHSTQFLDIVYLNVYVWTQLWECVEESVNVRKILHSTLKVEWIVFPALEAKYNFFWVCILTDSCTLEQILFATHFDIIHYCYITNLSTHIQIHML